MLRNNWRYLFLVAFFVAAIVIKDQRPPAKNNNNDLFPKISDVRCSGGKLRTITTSSSALVSTDGSMLIEDALVGAAPDSDYLISLNTLYLLMYYERGEVRGKEVDSPDQYKLRVSAVSLLAEPRQLGTFSVTNGRIMIPYQSRPGDSDLLMEVLKLPEAREDVYPRLEVGSISLIATASSPEEYKADLRSFSHHELKAEPGKSLELMDLRIRKIFVPLQVETDMSVAEIGLPLKQVGTGGSGEYFAAVTDEGGEVLATSRFTTDRFTERSRSLAAQSSDKYYYFSLPAELKSGKSYRVIVSGHNVAANSDHTLMVYARSLPRPSSVNVLGFGMHREVVTDIDLVISSDMPLPLTDLRTGPGEGYLIYESTGNFTDYFDPVSSGASKKYDFVNNAVVMSATGSLVYEISQPGRLLNNISVTLGLRCQNSLVRKVEYSTDQVTWRSLAEDKGSMLRESASFAPTQRVFVRVKPAAGSVSADMALRNIKIVGKYGQL